MNYNSAVWRTARYRAAGGATGSSGFQSNRSAQSGLLGNPNYGQGRPSTTGGAEQRTRVEAAIDRINAAGTQARAERMAGAPKVGDRPASIPSQGDTRYPGPHPYPNSNGTTALPSSEVLGDMMVRAFAEELAGFASRSLISIAIGFALAGAYRAFSKPSNRFWLGGQTYHAGFNGTQCLPGSRDVRETSGPFCLDLQALPGARDVGSAYTAGDINVGFAEFFLAYPFIFRYWTDEYFTPIPGEEPDVGDFPGKKYYPNPWNPGPTAPTRVAVPPWFSPHDQPIVQQDVGPWFPPFEVARNYRPTGFQPGSPTRNVGPLPVPRTQGVSPKTGPRAEPSPQGWRYGPFPGLTRGGVLNRPPPHRQRLPENPRTKEGKVRIRYKGAFKVLKDALGGTTEGLDLLDTLYDSLPEKFRKAEKRKRHGKDPNPLDKARLIWENFEKVDLVQWAYEFAANQVEDYLYGKGGQAYKDTTGRTPTRIGIGNLR